MTDFTVLCQLNNGCMACCGHDFNTKDRIVEALDLNTKEFEKINPTVKAQFLKFRDRAHPADLRNGVCRNLIEKNGKIFCPLHPALHNGDDLRKNHCDINYMCRTAKVFEHWDENKQHSFLEFIASKKLDNLTYSLLMNQDKLLEEFEKKKFEQK